jgi:hypothetical protein
MAAFKSPTVVNLVLSRSMTWNFTAMKRTCPLSGTAIPTGNPPYSITCLCMIWVSQSILSRQCFRHCRNALPFLEMRTTHKSGHHYGVGGCAEAWSAKNSHGRTLVLTVKLNLTKRPTKAMNNASCTKRV